MRLTQEVAIPGMSVGRAKFSGLVTPMPGCSTLAVSHDVYNHTSAKHCGRTANLMRQDQVSQLGFSGMVCTVNAKNDVQIHILRSTGWIIGPSFINRKTEEEIFLFVHNLAAAKR